MLWTFWYATLVAASNNAGEEPRSLSARGFLIEARPVFVANRRKNHRTFRRPTVAIIRQEPWELAVFECLITVIGR